MIENFLATLVDRLIGETSEAAIVAALAPLAEPAGAEISSPMRVKAGGVHDGLSIRFRPGMPLATVVGAFGWEAPVAWSGDVHMSSWSIAPLAVARSASRRPRLGRWVIGARLDGWPRGLGDMKLAEVGRSGPSPLYDLTHCRNTVVSIVVVPVDD
jgi:hypothetical protein